MQTALITSLWIGLWSLTMACDRDVKVAAEELSAPGEAKAPTTMKLVNAGDCIDPDLKKLPDHVFLTLCSGERGQGELALSSLMPAECAADGAVGCVSTETFKAADMALAVPTHIKSGVTIAGVTGTLAKPCSADGELDCVANGQYKAAKMANFSAAHIANGMTVAGVLGTGAWEAHVDCVSDGVVGCATTPTYKSANTGAYLSSDIKSGVTIAGVAGSLENCTDGASACIVLGPTFKAAASADLTAGNIKDGVTIAGVAGSHGPPCASDGAANCVVDGSTYKAAATATAVAGNIKKGVVIAGVTGDYPSSTYPLAGANGGVADLDATTFNTKIKSSADFEWFDSVGNPYTRAGEPNIAAGLILNGVSIFGTVGDYVPGGMSVSSFAATKKDDGIVGLTWTRNGGAGVIIVKRAGASVTFTPDPSVNYAQGYTSGSDVIIYRGSAATVDDTDVVHGTTYYYKAFVYNGDNGYSTASSESSVLYTDGHICGRATDKCYDDAAAKTAGTATTPLGKNLEYVDNGSGFMVWKEVGSSKVLRANGLDEWAMKLNLDGKGLMAAGNEFLGYTSLAGRKCPPSVYISDTNKVSSGNCLYYTSEASTQTLSAAGTSQTVAASMGLNQWNNYNGGQVRWYVGNIKTCSDRGMRLPTIFETTTTTTSNANYPSDAIPTFAGAADGIPSHPGGYTWTASGYKTIYDSYWRWSGTDVLAGISFVASYHVHCVLP